MEVFQMRDDLHWELLESCWDAYAKGAQWHEKKVVKHCLDVDLSILSSRESPSNYEYDGSNASEGGEAKPPTP